MPAPRRTLLWLALFAIAMALVEAAIVVYLRAIYYPHNPLALFPLQILSEAHLRLELLRETATILMLVAVACVAQAGAVRRFAAFLFLFGLWDLAYYAWLKLTLGWPVGWLEWDILFLIPWPWFGPWIAPAAIALLFVGWGGYVLAAGHDYRTDWMAATLFAAGSLLALAAFLAPAAPLLARGTEAFRGFVPAGFWWGLYLPGFALMSAALGYALRPSRRLS